MHSQLETPDGLTFMAADAPNSMQHTPAAAFSMSLSGDDEAKLRGYWEGLSDGGTVIMPIVPAPWGDTLRHVRRPVRHQLDGQHRRRRLLKATGSSTGTSGQDQGTILADSCQGGCSANSSSWSRACRSLVASSRAVDRLRHLGDRGGPLEEQLHEGDGTRVPTGLQRRIFIRILLVRSTSQPPVAGGRRRWGSP